MRVEFVERVMKSLLKEGMLRRSDSILAVCAGQEERSLFSSLHFTNVTITNVEACETGEEYLPFRWSPQDAQNLSFEDNQFDFAFVSDGLHHCASPHRGLLEMYRVARKGIIMFEARDSMLMRLATRFGLASEFELEAVVDHHYRCGGVNNTSIPNFIYRWTERELKKTIQSYNPTGKHHFRFYYGLSLPYQTSAMKKGSLKLCIVRLADPVLTISTRVLRRLNNLLAMVVLKPKAPADLWPWLVETDGHLSFNREYAEKVFRHSLSKGR